MNLFQKSLSIALFAASTLVVVAIPGTVRAADEHNVSTGATLSGPGLAAHGYDVVSFFSDKPTVGSDKFALAHDGATYRFASQADLDLFKADPGKYEPAFGGYCAYGAALGKKFDGDPRYWKIVSGKLYLNLNGDIQAKWSEDIAGNIAKANDNWTRIQGTKVGAL